MPDIDIYIHIDIEYCRTEFNGGCLTVTKIAMENGCYHWIGLIEMMLIIPHIRVVLYLGLLTLDHYHSDFLMILKETLTFPLLLNLVISTGYSIFLSFDNPQLGAFPLDLGSCDIEAQLHLANASHMT